MKKSLIAAAALTAIAGAAQAQSSVEVYGLLDMSYSELKSSGSGTDYKLSSTGGVNSANGTGVLNGSRLGFRGTEDLGAGNKAKFVVEYGVNLTAAEDASTADSTKGQAMGNLRVGTVALENAKLGTIVAGTMYSPVDAASGSLAGAQAHGGTNNGQGGASLLKYGQYARAANGIVYVSPSFSGLTVKLGTQEAENVRGSTDAKANGAKMWALDYVQGNLKAGYAYEKIKNATVATGGTSTAAKYAFTGMIGTANDNEIAIATSTTTGHTVKADLTYNVVGAQYNFGFATLGLNQAKFKMADNSKGTSTGVIFDKFESTQNSLSFSVPVTAALTLGGAYTDGSLEFDGAKQFDTKGTDLLAVYTLSKRTNVYLINSVSKFDKTASATSGLANAKQSQTAVGVRHAF